MLKKLGISVRNDSKPLELTCIEIFYSITISCHITQNVSSIAIKYIINT
jgi:hypothetical protein